MKNLLFSTLNAQLTLFNFRKLLLMVLPLVFLWSCKEEDNNNFSNSLKSIELDYVSVTSCQDTTIISGDTTVCIEPNCSCYSSTCCTRSDLDPCSYSDMYQYAVAVACELNKIVNGCTQRNFQYPCYVIEMCYELGSAVHPDIEAGYEDGNPFRYCSAAECGTFYCPAESWPYRHIEMTIAYQNAIVSFLRNVLGPLVKPQCPNNQSAVLGNIFLQACKNINSDPCENLSETNCWDTYLKVRFEFWCCPGIEG